MYTTEALAKIKHEKKIMYRIQINDLCGTGAALLPFELIKPTDHCMDS